MNFLLAASSVDPNLEQNCGSSPSWLCETVYDASGGNRILLGITDWVVTVTLVFIGAWVISFLARRYFARVIARMVAPDKSVATRQLERIGISTQQSGDDEQAAAPNEPDLRRLARVDSITAVVSSTVTVIVWTFALIMALGAMGISLAPLIAGAGFAGVALGFGAQSLVKDCISGLFMLLEDQYGIGDVVDLGEAVGTVQEITLRATVLRGVDGTVWHVPNGEVRRVGNNSQLWSIALIDIDVAYESDLQLARQVIGDATIATCENERWAPVVLDAPEVLGVETLGADGITMRVTVRTRPGEQWGLQRALREEMKGALDNAGIEIPYPQRTIWVRSDEFTSPNAASRIENSSPDAP